MEEYNEEQLIKEYMGEKADKYLNSNLNWDAAIGGAFFGPAWFFAVKAYLIGFVFLGITFVAGLIASAVGMKKAYLIMGLIYLFSANKLYIWDAKRKVKKILETNNNLSQEELINIIRKKGGWSNTALILYIVILIAVIALIMLKTYAVL